MLVITETFPHIGRCADAETGGLAGAGAGWAGLGPVVLAGSWPASVMMAATAWGVDRPGDLGGSDPWKDAESCLHSGSTLMSCANAR